MGVIKSSVLAWIAIIGTIASIIGSSGSWVAVGKVAEQAPSAMSALVDWLWLKTGFRVLEANIYMVAYLLCLGLIIISSRMTADGATAQNGELRYIAWRRCIARDKWDSSLMYHSGWGKLIYVPIHMLHLSVYFGALFASKISDPNDWQFFARSLLGLAGHGLIHSAPSWLANWKSEPSNGGSTIDAKFQEWAQKNNINIDMLSPADSAPFDQIPADVRGFYFKAAKGEYAISVYVKRMWVVIIGAVGVTALGYASARGWLAQFSP